MQTQNDAPEFLYQALEGFYSYCALRAAFANRIFDRLDQPATAEEIASRLASAT